MNFTMRKNDIILYRYGNSKKVGLFKNVISGSLTINILNFFGDDVTTTFDNIIQNYGQLSIDEFMNEYPELVI